MHRTKLTVHSLRVRLFGGLLLLGVVPLVVALVLVSGKAAGLTNGVLADALAREHNRILQETRIRLDEMEQAANALAADYAVQRFLDPGSLKTAAETKEYQEYLSLALRRELERTTAAEEICVRQENAGRIYCYGRGGSAGGETVFLPAESSQSINGSSGISGTAGGEVQGRFRVLQGNNSLPGNRSKLQYLLQVNGLASVAPTGSVMVTAGLDKVAGTGSHAEGYGGYSLEDGEGSLLYASPEMESRSAKPEADKMFVLPFRHGGLNWTSRLVMDGNGLNAVTEPLNRVAGISGAVILILAALAALLLSHWVARPFRHLQSLMKRTEKGDLKAYWTSGGSQEMNELGESYNQMLNRLEDLIRQVKREEALKKEAEMEALQYQLNPHFLYNTLNTIKWVAKLHKTPQISEAVSALVRLLQASLGKKGDFITAGEEAGLIKDYMAIQSFRYGENIRLEVQIDPSAEHCLLPRLLLQPLVENAVIHGIEPLRREGVIQVRIWVERELLFCQVADNGIGMEEETCRSLNVEPQSPRNAVRQPGAAATSKLRERMSGIGLRHIRDKIRLYYGPDYAMSIVAKPMEGTSVRLCLPVHRNEEEAS
ncbi:MAG: sensor histidine kinase [Paenibacillaceae bacterium]|jgi:sensor histidine kinase YesM|nr:sensor histidine kinase [Paenibacillaceae bacterium]